MASSSSRLFVGSLAATAEVLSTLHTERSRILFLAFLADLTLDFIGIHFGRGTERCSGGDKSRRGKEIDRQRRVTVAAACPRRFSSTTETAGAAAAGVGISKTARHTGHL